MYCNLHFIAKDRVVILVSVWAQFSTDGSPLALWLYSSEQHSVHWFPYSICRSSVRHFPERSWTVVAFPCFTVGRSLDLYGKEGATPSTSLLVMGEIAGVNTAPLGEYLHSTKTKARWVEGFHELNGYVFDLEKDGLRQVVLCPRLTMR